MEITAQQKIEQMKRSRTFQAYRKAYTGHSDIDLYHRILRDIKNNQLQFK